MFGSWIRYKTHLFITICFMCMLSAGNQIKVLEDLDYDNEQRLAASGHLYDVFRKRMERMSRGLMLRPNYDILKSTLVNNEKSVQKLKNIIPEFDALEGEKLNLEDTLQQNKKEDFDNSNTNFYNSILSQDNDRTYQLQNGYDADLLKTYIPQTNADFLRQDGKNEQNSILKNPLKIRKNLQKNQLPLYDANYSPICTEETKNVKAESELPAREIKDSAAFSGSTCACSDETSTGNLPPNIMAILEKVLSNLERIDQEKQEDEDAECSSEGTPCDLCGLWNSRTLGLALDISTETINPKNTRKTIGTARKNILLHIAAEDCTPPKHHNIMNCDWSFMGSALKALGGPFYMYAQPPRGNMIATFVGYCRVCGGTDTIFGSWSFALPSTDCQNIATAFEHKPDIMRRNNMEEKREERYKNILYKQKFGKKV